MSSAEQIYLCLQCRNLFKQKMNSVLSDEKDLTCPECGSSRIESLPSWAPVGSNLDKSQDAWEYECQDCHKTFKLPVPVSPSQEKKITCPDCNSGHIHKLTPMGSEPLYCG